MGRGVAIWTVIVVLSVFSAAYVTNTVLYLTPPNPVKAVWHPLIVGLAHPLFAQNWHLFAPDPIRSNFVLTARCRSDAGVTRWHDLTMPALARLQQDRASPAGRLIRVQQAAMRSLLAGNPGEWQLLACRRDRRSDACRRRGEDDRRVRETGHYLLARVASAMCDALVGPGRATAIQTSVLIHQPPPWSRRDRPDAEGTTRMMRLPWAPYAGRVAAGEKQ